MAGIDLNAFGQQFGVKCIDIVDEQVRHTTANAVSGERRQMQPDSVARDTGVARIRLRIVSTMGKFARKAEAVAIKFFRGSEVRNVKERNGALQQSSP